MGNLRGEQRLVTLAEAVNGHFDGAFGEAQAGSHFAIGGAAGTGRQKPFQFLEDGRAGGGGGLFPVQAREYLVEQGKCPTTIKKFVRAEAVRRFIGVPFLGGEGIQGDDGEGAAAFGGLGFIVFIGQEAFEGQQQEGAEAAFGAVGRRQIIFFQADGEKPLDQIFGVMGASAGAAGEGIERIPVALAKPFQRFPAPGGIGPTGGQHDAPMGGGKPLGGAGFGRVRFVLHMITGNGLIYLTVKLPDNRRREKQNRGVGN